MGFVFLACARVRGLGCPACLVVSCGCRKKRGENLPGWFSPRFFFCGADDGTRTRCLHLGRVTLSLLSFIRVLRHLVLLVAFACLGARGWRLYLFISPTSVGGVRVFRQHTLL